MSFLLFVMLDGFILQERIEDVIELLV